MKHLLTALLLASSSCMLSAESAPPNIILIFCDDMGYADIGPFGATGYDTPNLDRMAKEGIKFTDFLVSQSVCSPSRAGLLTGCYNVRVDVPGNFNPSSKTGLNPKEELIPEVLKKKGYATAMFGKWHLGHLPKFLPTSQGFDQWFGLPYSNDMWPLHPTAGGRFPDLPLMEGEKIVKPAMTPADQAQLTTQYTERAVQFIEQHKDEPFMVYLAHAMPHVPLYASDKFNKQTKRGIFGDVVAEIDWGVGQILDTLKRLKLDDNTLLIFTSDNGPWLSYGDHAGSAKPLREGKGTAFEGGRRVPCVMHWPGKIPAGTTCDELASTIDLLPTIAGLAGAPLPANKIDGKNIWPLMAGEKGATSPHQFFYYYGGSKLTAVRSGKWKLILPHTYGHIDKPGANGRPGRTGRRKIELSLFNLATDIGETNDVAHLHQEIVERLQVAATKIRLELGDAGVRGNEIRPK